MTIWADLKQLIEEIREFDKANIYPMVTSAGDANMIDIDAVWAANRLFNANLKVTAATRTKYYVIGEAN